MSRHSSRRPFMVRGKVMVTSLRSNRAATGGRRRFGYRNTTTASHLLLFRPEVRGAWLPSRGRKPDVPARRRGTRATAQIPGRRMRFGPGLRPGFGPAGRSDPDVEDAGRVVRPHGPRAGEPGEGGAKQ